MLGEKQAILAAWASDACAVEVALSLRSAPGGAGPVSIDEIFYALCELYKGGSERYSQDWADRQIRFGIAFIAALQSFERERGPCQLRLDDVAARAITLSASHAATIQQRQTEQAREAEALKAEGDSGNRIAAQLITLGAVIRSSGRRGGWYRAKVPKDI